MDWDALALSLRLAWWTMIVLLPVGIVLGRLLAWRRFRGKALVEALLALPLVLPPTVLGYYLLLGLGRQSPLGRGIEAAFGEGLVFTPQGAVVAAFVAALPFLVRAAQGGFEQLDTTYEEAARTLGRTEWAIFLTVTAPLAWRSIVAGLALCFARAVGEFGTTLMVAGNIPGRTQTASIAIYDAVQGGRLDQANATALLLSATTGLVLLLLTRLGRAGGW